MPAVLETPARSGGAGGDEGGHAIEQPGEAELEGPLADVTDWPAFVTLARDEFGYQGSSEVAAALRSAGVTSAICSPEGKLLLAPEDAYGLLEQQARRRRPTR